MQNLAGSWTEISSGEMVEIGKVSDPNGNYKFNFFFPKESYIVQVESTDTVSATLKGLERYEKLNSDILLNINIENGNSLLIKSAGKKLLATFRSNSQD